MNYHTKDTKFYEVSKNFLCVKDLPQIPRVPEVNISEDHYNLLSDYKKSYLQRVRQLSIRQQSTKSKARTLPLYAYTKPAPEAQDVNLRDILTGKREVSVTESRLMLFSIGEAVQFDTEDRHLQLQTDCSICLG